MLQTIKFWCIHNTPTILLSLGALCLYKPITIESLGAFFAVMGISMLINSPKLTYRDVEEIAMNISEVTCQEYIKAILTSSEDPLEDFNPDTFPPFVEPSDN